MDFLNRELGVERLLLEGGGVVNGSFLRAGLIDEVSVIVWPVVDGAADAPCVFDSTREEAGRAAPRSAMQLLHAESMSDGAVWPRYRLENQA
jgi:riboflavin biosynthesis pyrimidine reductase